MASAQREAKRAAAYGLRRRDQLGPDEEPVQYRDVAGHRRGDRQAAREWPNPDGAEQSPHADDPELLDHHPEHLVVEPGIVPAERALGQHVTDLQRRPVAGEPVAEGRRRAAVAVVEVPIGEEAGDFVIGGERVREARRGHRERLIGAAVQEAEVEDEGAAQRPERRGHRELAQEAAIKPIGATQHDPLDRPQHDQERSRLPDRRIGVVGPEGEHRGDTGGGEGEGEQERHAAQPTPHRQEHRQRRRQGGQHQVLEQHP
jgi:hypothetical protein